MRVLVTGGAGFVGCNLAASLAGQGHEVVVLDNLSRAGSEDNLRWLLEQHSARQRITYAAADVRDPDAVTGVVRNSGFTAVAHCAAQTAVTSSVVDPRTDFDINAAGTLNVLEAVRHHAPEASVLFMSTNKVYGSLAGAPIAEVNGHQILSDYPSGVPENVPVAPVTPYGCSKYAAESYVVDYSTTFGIDTAVFRASCIYGPRQNGTTDQGWVSWFATAILRGLPITIYGDGRQVRDLLHVDDLVRAMTTVLVDRVGTNQVYNIGGGPDFAVSIWAEVGPLLEEVCGVSTKVSYAAARPGDQAVWISDTRKATDLLGWRPNRAPTAGIGDLVGWIREHRSRSGGLSVVEG